MDDGEYYEARAEQELELAQGSDHPAVVRAHFLLAGLYLDRLYNPDGDAPDGNGQAMFPPASASAA
jgi:hypothetical protein